ncbi:MAG TPA: hypothetical protein VMJ72_01010 [Candidatus Paceibacterota bacterium]|nr:hypothetical protein [Candidatus Paceibacterota bacterium]
MQEIRIKKTYAALVLVGALVLGVLLSHFDLLLADVSQGKHDTSKNTINNVR